MIYYGKMCPKHCLSMIIGSDIFSLSNNIHTVHLLWLAHNKISQLTYQFWVSGDKRSLATHSKLLSYTHAHFLQPKISKTHKFTFFCLICVCYGYMYCVQYFNHGPIKLSSLIYATAGKSDLCVSIWAPPKKHTQKISPNFHFHLKLLHFYLCFVFQLTFLKVIFPEHK